MTHVSTRSGYLFRCSLHFRFVCILYVPVILQLNTDVRAWILADMPHTLNDP